jgi:hypothetical protein
MDSAPIRHRSTFAIGTHLFIRLLALVHLCAFASLWIQKDGLIGRDGILPAGQFLKAAHEALGAQAFWEVPTLCWTFGTGHFLDILCAAGIAVSLLLLYGVAPAICLALLWVGYLSLVSIAGDIPGSLDVEAQPGTL